MYTPQRSIVQNRVISNRNTFYQITFYNFSADLLYISIYIYGRYERQCSVYVVKYNNNNVVSGFVNNLKYIVVRYCR